LDPSKCETIMTGICVEYLLLNKLMTGKPTDIPTYHTIQNGQRQSEMDEQHDIGDLLSYSSKYWADHFLSISFELKNAVTLIARVLC
jgi:hypothetical protein